PQIISFLGVPLYFSDKVLGGLFLAGTSPFTSLHLKSITTIATFGAIAIANSVHFLEVQKMLEAVMVSLATAIDSRDPCTAGHSRRTAQYAWALAKAVNEDEELFPNFKFTKEQLREIYYAALLHDVGKIGVKESVLNKATKVSPQRIEVVYLKLKLMKKLNKLPHDFPDIKEVYDKLVKINTSGYLSDQDREFLKSLSEMSFEIDGEKFYLLDEEELNALLIPRGNLLPHEWKEIKKHPLESYRILEQIPFPENMKNLRIIVRQHHEKLDGTGYPNGRKNDEILFQSRILAICDIFDALTAADRPYKKAFPIEKAVDILRQEAKAGKLDQSLVEVFIKKVLMQK
ncbi:MAG: HD domain-containing protein, partial [Thermodesulfobacteria bacterium]|nr:HD domain-containing protein [Thermodesulfobacteriota bacterium]